MRSWLRCHDKYQIIETGPCVARCYVHSSAMPQKKKGIVGIQDPMACLFANNSAFGRVIEQGVFNKYMQLEQTTNAKYLYLQHGLEKDEFDEAVEDVGFLVKDFADFDAEYSTDDDDYDDEDDD
mmetsp:Transcript_25969/g.41188  ORF Transcript_25969/g.41188 Transcript_25969/m.41188 type:complete len:124 (+) Transcript_25969:1-372(+)